MKIEVSLFRFDHKSDYLPYYTKHPLKIKDEKTLLDVLKTINEDQAFGFVDCEHYTVAVNGVYTLLNITIEQIKENFGKEITIEPMSIRRAHTDLLINEEDFNERFETFCNLAQLNTFDSYNQSETLHKYNSYKLFYYASNTLNYETNYIGDAVLLLAYDLIQQFPNKEKAILKALSSCEIGIEYHTNLSSRIFDFNPEIETRIQSLKEKLHLSNNEQNFRVNHTYIMDFGEFKGSQEIKHSFKDFNIAYYEGINACNQTKTLLDALDARVLDIESMKHDLALDTFHKNPDLTFKLASTVMLDAFDQNANFIVVDNEELFYLFDYNRKELSRVSGRDVNIPVIHKNELEKLAMGIHGSVRESLNKHIVNPELI